MKAQLMRRHTMMNEITEPKKGHVTRWAINEAFSGADDKMAFAHVVGTNGGNESYDRLKPLRLVGNDRCQEL
ncbi:hypothetical protein Bpfe_012812 [Biomphalaria pfeifferi]|uniref:Uncharacterized protein n=1 Tax=Biomphalaria pfeifferi TaxID=112525 RepID=A0AAD8BNZ5_BIOPF|nr:hypothetical protein Bpfe_012812 [Biomphalaria pfeifferi]